MTWLGLILYTTCTKKQGQQEKSLLSLLVVFITLVIGSLFRHFLKCSLDDVDSLEDFLLSDAQGRCEADDVVVSGFRQQSVVAQFQADVPCCLALDGLSDDGIEQATTAHLHDKW